MRFITFLLVGKVLTAFEDGCEFLDDFHFGLTVAFHGIHFAKVRLEGWCHPYTDIFRKEFFMTNN